MFKFLLLGEQSPMLHCAKEGPCALWDIVGKPTASSSMI